MISNAPAKAAVKPGGLYRPHFFLQDKVRQDHRKKRAEFIEHIGVRQHQMIDGIKIAQETRGTKQAPPKHGLLIHRRHAQRGDSLTPEGKGGDKQRRQIAEQRLLSRRKIAGEMDKSRHPRKKQGRQKDI